MSMYVYENPSECLALHPGLYGFLAMNVSRINRSNQLGKAAKKSASKSGTGAGAFQMPETSASRPNSTPANVNTVGSVDALLALQAVPDATGRRARAVKRAENMLDILEDIKISVLSGRIPQSHLNRLIAVLNARRDALNDNQLIEVIDEIELRAKVELAKLGHIAA